MKRLLLAIVIVGALARPSPAGAMIQPEQVGVTKILLIVEENHTAEQARVGMPYLTSLAATYAQSTGDRAITHPSLPNYLELSGGTTHGITDDKDPSAHPIKGASVFGNALSHGKTTHVYADEEPTNCQHHDGTASSLYLVRHTGAPYYVEERAACAVFDTSTASLQHDITAGALPNVGWLIPAKDHDAHAPYSLAGADSYLKLWLPKILAGPDFTSGALAVVITADEGVGTNQSVPLIVLSKSLQNAHLVVNTPSTHHDLWHWQLRVGGTTPSWEGDVGTEFGL